MIYRIKKNSNKAPIPGATLLLAVFASIFLFHNGIAEDTPKTAQENDEFFERNIRPVLSENCFSCHGPSKQKSGLRLDTRAGLLAGGETGVVVVPGKPNDSRLVRAIRYDDPDLQMPPRGKLTDQQIADIEQWILIGAQWPDDPISNSSASNPSAAPTFDLTERKNSHWAWRPIQATLPPAVKETDWPRNETDRFILARLEKEGLRHTQDAARQTLIRRASFDLIGLPPKPEEIASFVNDTSPDAWEKVVDRLLASPAFGERWGRHWLDLVRYAESFGHEQDFPIHEAWRYRDYVIRAFNADVPYDQFLTEHLAGDLLPEPRRNPLLDFNESIIGTGFWFMGQATHAPVDSLQDEADRMDNQLDVFSKTFLGLTVACARCHDHKFDAISTRDYYGLMGYLKSSRRQYAPMDVEGQSAKAAGEMRRMRSEGTRHFTKWMRDIPNRTDVGIAKYLLAAREMNLHSFEYVAEAAAVLGLDANRLKAWAKALDLPELNDPNHPLHMWRQWTQSSGEAVANQNKHLKSDEIFEDFNRDDFGKWKVSGHAFGEGPTRNGDWSALTNGAVPSGIAHSGLESGKLRGVLYSPTFQIEKPNILYRVAATGGVIRLVVDSYTMRDFHDLLFKDMRLEVNTGGKFAWVTQSKDVARYIGHRAHIEVEDTGDGHIALDEIRFSDEATPGKASASDSKNWDSPSDLARAIESAAIDALHQWGERNSSSEPLIIWLVEQGLLNLENPPAELHTVLAEIKRIESNCPVPQRALAMMDGGNEDSRVYIRGGSKNLGENVPRRFLEAISGNNQPPPSSGSGRLELAHRILDSSNPFPARVMVNRIWSHLFGRGIVGTPDNFGALGETPTHPELLDFLADRFRKDHWSIKKMIRYLMLSRTYQMQCLAADRESEEKDPSNLSLHRMRTKRLEGEAVRDAILAVSGRLNTSMGGEPVPIFLTAFLDGRNPPPKGPLDGHGRRSIYLAVRRNYLSPMLLAFDSPIPDSTVGRRNVSNVPAQALILMNDPFVKTEAERWSQRIIKVEHDPWARVERMYEEALGRPPTSAETYQALVFISRQSKIWMETAGRESGESPRANSWTDLAHVLFMLKEFIFIS